MKNNLLAGLLLSIAIIPNAKGADAGEESKASSPEVSFRKLHFTPERRVSSAGDMLLLENKILSRTKKNHELVFSTAPDADVILAEHEVSREPALLRTSPLRASPLHSVSVPLRFEEQADIYELFIVEYTRNIINPAIEAIKFSTTEDEDLATFRENERYSMLGEAHKLAAEMVGKLKRK